MNNQGKSFKQITCSDIDTRSRLIRLYHAYYGFDTHRTGKKLGLSENIVKYTLGIFSDALPPPDQREYGLGNQIELQYRGGENWNKMIRDDPNRAVAILGTMKAHYNNFNSIH